MQIKRDRQLTTVMYRDTMINKIKQELKDKDMTQKQFANILKITEPTLCRYLNGQRTISLNMAIKIADYFNISLDEMVGRKCITKEK